MFLTALTRIILVRILVLDVTVLRSQVDAYCICKELKTKSPHLDEVAK